MPSKRKTDSDSDSKDLSYSSTSVFPPPGLVPTNGSNHTSTGGDSHVSKKPSPGSKNLTTPSPGPRDVQGSSVSVVIHSPSNEKKKEIQNAQWTRVETPPVTGVSKRHYTTDKHEHDHERSRRAQEGDDPRAAAAATATTKEKVDRRAVTLGIGRPAVPILTERPKVHIRQQLYRSFVRKLSKIKGPPVTLAPSVDDRVLTGIAANFEFVNEYKLRKGVVPVGEDFNAGCGCSTVCDPMRCMCLSDAEEADEKLLPYQTAPDDAGMVVLTPEFRQRRAMIFECSSRCGCRGKCWNNVVQRGRTVRFEIFHTGNRGFGMFPSRRTFCQY